MRRIKGSIEIARAMYDFGVSLSSPLQNLN
jgi:hypothetical protein